jgi:hypothetical protein
MSLGTEILEKRYDFKWTSTLMQALANPNHAALIATIVKSKDGVTVSELRDKAGISLKDAENAIYKLVKLKIVTASVEKVFYKGKHTHSRVVRLSKDNINTIQYLIGVTERALLLKKEGKII